MDKRIILTHSPSITTSQALTHALALVSRSNWAPGNMCIGDGFQVESRANKTSIRIHVYVYGGA